MDTEVNRAFLRAIIFRTAPLRLKVGIFDALAASLFTERFGGLRSGFGKMVFPTRQGVRAPAVIALRTAGR
jgi:hypothetical protein